MTAPSALLRAAATACASTGPGATVVAHDGVAGQSCRTARQKSPPAPMCGKSYSRNGSARSHSMLHAAWPSSGRKIPATRLATRPPAANARKLSSTAKTSDQKPASRHLRPPAKAHLVNADGNSPPGRLSRTPRAQRALRPRCHSRRPATARSRSPPPAPLSASSYPWNTPSFYRRAAPAAGDNPPSESRFEHTSCVRKRARSPLGNWLATNRGGLRLCRQESAETHDTPCRWARPLGSGEL